jgi:hypothetical protein
MSLFVAWVAFPAVLILLATGCGLLLRAASGGGLPAAIVPAAGVAVIMVVTGFLTMSGTTAEWSTPVVLGLAVAGFALTSDWGMPDISPWEFFAAAGVFAAFAAPVVLSGEATFAGYIKLDDTATWMAFTDRLMEEGRSASGLAPSTYEATIAVNLPAGYPVGAFLPIGPARELVGYDLAWLVQPYMAVMAAMLALVLAQISRPLIQPAGLRALVAFIAAQPALLFGYALWGGIKEVAAALIIALVAATAISLISEWSSLRRLLPLAIAAAALLATLGAGGAVWLATILIPAAILAAREGGFGQLLPRALALGGALLVASVPVLFGSGKLFSPTQGALVNDSELGNLLGSLNNLQVVGIWPAGDFRLPADQELLTYILIGLAIVLAGAAIYAAIRAEALELCLYGLGTLAGCLVIVVVASPWVDGKALASAAPAALLLACAGAAFLWGTEARVFGVVALAAIGAGVIWSNALGYRNVNLAPREQLAELERIGEDIAGQGPALTTDPEVYGGRHFLREADAENSTDLRRNTIPLVDGSLPDEVPSLDMDQVSLPALLGYRTLVLRRSPSHSRPPSPYRLVDRGRFYDVWQLAPGAESGLLRHLGLGDPFEPTAVPDCGAVLALAREARERPGARLAVARRAPITPIEAPDTTHPAAWEMDGAPEPLYLVGSGDLQAQFFVPRAGRYTVWFGGSVRGEAQVSVDGREVGSVDGQLANAQEYVDLGRVELTRGSHRLAMHYDSEDLAPGTATPEELPYPSLPFVLSSTPDDPGIAYLEPGDARELCGQRLDWIEVVDK